MVNIWDNRKYINDIFYIVGECMMSVFPKTMKEQTIYMMRYKGPIGLALMQLRQWWLRLGISTVRPLLLICVFVEYG